MQKKIQTEITKVTLNSPIFTDKVFYPTLVNFIYGTNGTGKSTISRLMDQEDYPGLEFKQPKCNPRFYSSPKEGLSVTLSEGTV